MNTEALRRAWAAGARPDRTKPPVVDVDSTICRVFGGRVWPRAGTADRNLHPHGVFPCTGDERWIAIACESDAQRSALATMVGGLDDATIAAWTSSRDMDAATAELQAVGVPSQPVENSPECVRDPQLVHRAHFVELPHGELGTVTIEGPLARFSATPGSPRGPARCSRAHASGVYRDPRLRRRSFFAELLVVGALE